MTQEEIEILNSVVTAQSWKLVEQVIEAQLQKLSSIEEVDMNKSADEIKLELNARQLAKQTLNAMLTELRGFGAQEKLVNPLNRSFK